MSESNKQNPVVYGGNSKTEILSSWRPAIFHALTSYFDQGLPYRREVACFWTRETGIFSLTTSNQSAAVEFDWFGIWGTLRHCRPRPERVFMWHTHPPGCDAMSEVDANMVYGWQVALGLPVIFLVVLEKEARSYLCHQDNGEFYRDDQGLRLHARFDPSQEFLHYVLYGLSCLEETAQPALLEQIRHFMNQSHTLWGHACQNLCTSTESPSTACSIPIA
jgi:hypothetical protein